MGCRTKSLALSAALAEFNDVSEAVLDVAWIAVAVVHRFFTRRADRFCFFAVEIALIDGTFAGVARCGLSAFDELHFQYPSSIICWRNAS